MPAIRLEGLTKRYGHVEILHGIDLSMNDGEFTVLVGPSGCGKSTTLRMIAGLEDVSAGSIRIDGRDVTDAEPIDRGVAMVFQDYALYPHMDVAANMSFALRLSRQPRAEIDRRVAAAAEILGIGHLLKRKPKDLSGGQRQRVALGRALVRDSPILLFDEPLSNLDAKLRTHMRAELALLRRRVAKNMIYVTHDQIEAMTLGDRIVVMNGGHIQQQGTPEDLYRRPANRFVAGFIGSPAMNFLPGILSRLDGRLVVTGEGFTQPVGPEMEARLARHSGPDVILGVRPSALHVAPEARDGYDLEVLVVEYTGSSSTLVCECGGARVTAEVRSDAAFTQGARQRFVADDIHLFDAKTEIAL